MFPQILHGSRATRGQRPFRATNEPQRIDDRRTAFHDAYRFRLAERDARITRYHREAEPARDELQDKADLIAEALPSQTADARIARKAPAQQAARHHMPVRLIDEAAPSQIEI